MTAQPDVSSPAPDRYSLGIGKLIVPSLIGGLVALTLGVYGRLHHPTGVVVNIAGFTSAGYVKSWLATIATFFAIVQVTSALVMYGKVPRVRPLVDRQVAPVVRPDRLPGGGAGRH